jgi:hypothetical protein
VETLCKPSKEKVSRSGDDDVVHIQKDVGKLLSMAIDEEGHIRLGGDEPKPMREVGKALVPRPGRLLEPVERLAETTDIVRTTSVNKAGRLLTVDLLIKSAMEEGVLDVQLVNRP